MFIPDPGSDFFPSRIPDPNCLHPESRIRIKEFKYFIYLNPKKWFLSSRKYDPGCLSGIRMLTFYPSRIRMLTVYPSRIRIRNTDFDCPKRDSHAVHYIQKSGERGVCTLVVCSLATVTSCIQCFRSGSGSGSALILVAGSGSGSRRAKMTHKNRKKSRIFMFLSTGTGCSLLRAEGFSCRLGLLYGGLGISKLQFLIKKIEIKFPAIIFFQF